MSENEISKKEPTLAYRGLSFVMNALFMPAFWAVTIEEKNNNYNVGTILVVAGLQAVRIAGTFAPAALIGGEVAPALAVAFAAAGCVDLVAVGFQTLGKLLEPSQKSV